MSGQSHSEDRLERTMDQQRTRAVEELESLAAASLGRTFGTPAAPGNTALADLARTLARDLTAVGFVVHDDAIGPIPGGVWLAPAPDTPGVIVTWTQHEASAAVLGFPMYCELQRQLSLDVFEVLHGLGYPVRLYRGSAHIVTDFRPPFDGEELS
jgi:hypothetical protein